MELFKSEAPEQVRSAQKDRHIVGYLATLLSDVVSPYLSQQTWLRWQREVQLTAELIYYSLTTVRGDQTLGEEYANIVQVGPTGRRHEAPGLARRLVSVALHVVARYLLEGVLAGLSHGVRNRSLWNFKLSERQYQQLQFIVDTLYEIVVNANQLHLAIFYLYGAYYYLGKRLSGVRYLMVRYHTYSPSSNPYKVLGWLMLLQLGYKLARWILTRCRQSHQDSQEHDNPSLPDQGVVSRTIKCALCLENCANATAGPCGHTYCWRCIMEWLKQQRLCPTCRTVMLPRQLVLLQSFELSSN